MDFDNFISKEFRHKAIYKIKRNTCYWKKNINKSVLLEVLELNNETSMTSINVSLLKEKILTIGWVKDVIVEEECKYLLLKLKNINLCSSSN